jgi:hypothetical protein
MLEPSYVRGVVDPDWSYASEEKTAWKRGLAATESTTKKGWQQASRVLSGRRRSVSAGGGLPETPRNAFQMARRSATLRSLPGTAVKGSSSRAARGVDNVVGEKETEVLVVQQEQPSSSSPPPTAVLTSTTAPAPVPAVAEPQQQVKREGRPAFIRRKSLKVFRQLTRMTPIGGNG